MEENTKPRAGREYIKVLFKERYNLDPEKNWQAFESFEKWFNAQKNNSLYTVGRNGGRIRRCNVDVG